jgi:predicted dehydrogenase
MTLRRMSVGFVGGGINSAIGRTHMVASRMDGRFELVAGTFSLEQEVNDETAATWGVDPGRTYRSLDEMLVAESGRLDAIVVLTPTPQHAVEVETILGAGFDVICEKSLAGTSAEARALGGLADAGGRVLAVTYNYSGYPMVRELRARMRAGELGRIVAVQVEMPQESFLRVDSDGRHVQPQEWRQVDGAIPTVSLDLGTHCHHLTQFLLESEPVELVAVQAHHGAVTTVADYVDCIARHPGGIDVGLWFGKCALGNRNGLRIRVYGEDAAAEWVQINPEELRISDARGAIRIVDRATPGTRVASSARYERFKAGHPAGFIEAFANLYCDLADTLSGSGQPPGVDGRHVFGAADAAAGLEMMEAIVESSMNRSWVELPGRVGGDAT